MEIATNSAWDAAQLFGLVAVLCCLALLLVPIRPRRYPDGTLPVRWHELIGWTALISALSHVLLLLAADHRVIEHLKVTAPFYEWAGIVALLLILVLDPLSLASVRRRLWVNHRRFQAVHVAVASLLIGLLAVHVITTGHLVRGHILVVAYLAVSLVSVLGLLRTRPRLGRGIRAGTLANRLVFGRHSRKIVLIAVLTCFATSTLLSADAPALLRESFAQRQTPLKVAFPHEHHRQVECVECHHNFIDRTGSGSCYACHRSARADLQLSAEARFHDFCLGCHRSPPRRFEHHGPVSGCETCHPR